MELRSTEQELEGLRQLYMTLRARDERLARLLSPIHENETSNRSETNVTTSPLTPDNEASVSNAVPTTASLSQQSAAETLKMCDTLARRLLDREDSNGHGANDLPVRIEKFQKRLAESDPVTLKPRYGSKTASRVAAMLELYQQLRNNVKRLQEIDENGLVSELLPSSAKTLIDSIRHQADLEKQESLRREADERERRAHFESAVQQLEERRYELQRQKLEEARLRGEQEQRAQREAVLAIQRAQQAAVEAARQADRDWQNSIPKGEEGVREQLRVLLKATADDPRAQKVAVKALYTIFAQIVAHPEEPNFRRIRRDHAQFNQDIARHQGGKEFLIAAGFQYRSIDDVPCLFSREPDIEKDMDGWVAWFDLLKAALGILENHMK